MDKLPQDLVNNILSRLPIKSLLQCRRVCKLWHTSLSDPSFYLNQTSKPNPDLLLHYHFRLEISQIFFGKTNDVETQPSLSLKKVNLPSLDWSMLKDILVMGSCHGLLCLTTTRHFSSLPSNPIYLFNPITGEHHQLPNFLVPKCRKVIQFMSGFGYDVSKKEFKLVLVFFYKFGETIQNEVQVYTLGSNAWRRRLGNVPTLLIETHLVVSFVFVNSSLYWITMDHDSPDSKPVVVSFHLGVEEFQVFPTPESIGVNREATNPLENCLPGVLDGLLSLVDSSSEQCIDMWTMNSYDGNICWNKQFSVKQNLICQWPHEAVMPMQVMKNGEILLICHFTRLVAYNPRSNTCRSIEVDKQLRPHCFDAVPLLSSLISVKSICAITKKRRSRKRQIPS